MFVVITPNEQREGRHRIDAENKKTENLNFVVVQTYFWCQGPGYRRDKGDKKTVLSILVTFASMLASARGAGSRVLR